MTSTETASLTRRAQERLTVARGIAQGLSAHQTARRSGLHPLRVIGHRRRLSHWRVQQADLMALAKSIPSDDLDDILRVILGEREEQYRQKKRATRHYAAAK